MPKLIDGATYRARNGAIHHVMLTLAAAKGVRSAEFGPGGKAFEDRAKYWQRWNENGQTLNAENRPWSKPSDHDLIERVEITVVPEPAPATVTGTRQTYIEWTCPNCGYIHSSRYAKHSDTVRCEHVPYCNWQGTLVVAPEPAGEWSLIREALLERKSRESDLRAAATIQYAIDTGDVVQRLGRDAHAKPRIVNVLGYVNVYKRPSGRIETGAIHDTRAAAENADATARETRLTRERERVACIRIEANKWDR